MDVEPPGQSAGELKVSRPPYKSEQDVLSHVKLLNVQRLVSKKQTHQNWYFKIPYQIIINYKRHSKLNDN